MTMHHEPHVVERDRVVATDSSSPALLIIGILLAIGLAIGAWFAFNNDGDGTVVNNDNSEQIVPGDTSGDTTGDTTGDTGTTGDTTTP